MLTLTSQSTDEIAQSLRHTYETFVRQPAPLHWSPLPELPLDVALEAARTVGLDAELCRVLRINIVESNGCVSFLLDGRLLCSLPSAEYHDRLEKARAEEASP